MNKMLAMAGRAAVRDCLDILYLHCSVAILRCLASRECDRPYLHETYLNLGALCWAARDAAGVDAVSWQEGFIFELRQTMALAINLPLETEQKLLRRAAERGQDVTAFIRDLIEDEEPGRNGVTATPGSVATFDEILDPIRKGWAESGLSDEEVDQLFEEALQDVRQARRKGGPA